MKQFLAIAGISALLLSFGAGISAFFFTEWYKPAGSPRFELQQDVRSAGTLYVHDQFTGSVWRLTESKESTRYQPDRARWEQIREAN